MNKMNHDTIYTLHKLLEGFIITSEEWVIFGDKVISPRYQDTFTFGTRENSYVDECKKVIAEENQINFSKLSEEEHKKIGWFNIWQLAVDYQNNISKNAFADANAFEDGFKKAQQLLFDKMFTLEDILDAWELGAKEGLPLTRKKKQDLIESLSQKSWNIEIELEQVNNKSGASYSTETIYKPKLINGKIKILKLII